MRHAVILAIVAAYIALGTPNWLAGTDVPYALRAASYPLFHANAFHLIVNCIAAWSILGPRRATASQFACAFAISVIVYPLSFRPVIGLSNVLYAMLGQQMPPLSSPAWRSAPVVTFIIVTLAMALIPSISATTHIAAFLLGLATAGVRRHIATIDNDIRRAGAE